MLSCIKLRKKIVCVTLVIGGLMTLTLNSAVAQELISALSVSFSNSVSGLTATNVQDAIDEVEGRLDIVESSSVSKYTISDVSFAINTQVNIVHNLNTTTPMVSISITTAGDAFPRTNYRVIDADTIEVWQAGSGTTYTGDVVVIKP